MFMQSHLNKKKKTVKYVLYAICQYKNMIYYRKEMTVMTLVLAFLIRSIGVPHELA